MQCRHTNSVTWQYTYCSCVIIYPLTTGPPKSTGSLSSAASDIYNKQGWLSVPQKDIPALPTNLSINHSFLLSCGFSFIASTTFLLVWRLKSRKIFCNKYPSLARTIKWTWLVITHQAKTSRPFCFWQKSKLSIKMSLYSLRVNTSIQSFTAKLTK